MVTKVKLLLYILSCFFFIFWVSPTSLNQSLVIAINIYWTQQFHCCWHDAAFIKALECLSNCILIETTESSSDEDASACFGGMKRLITMYQMDQTGRRYSKDIQQISGSNWICSSFYCKLKPTFRYSRKTNKLILFNLYRTHLRAV